MIKKYSIILFILAFICPVQAENLNFLHIPIQEQGRIKPIDSFARNQIIKLYGKNKLTVHTNNTSYKVSAIDWLFSVITQQSGILDQVIFKIENPDVINALDLEPTYKSIYSFNQINTGFNTENNQTLINNLIQTEEKFLNLVEKQLLELYLKKQLFIDLYNSASCLLPMMSIQDSILATALQIKPNETISFSYYLKHQKIIHQNLKNMIDTYELESNIQLLSELNMLMENITIFENELFRYVHSKSTINSNVLKIFPNSNNNMEWLSPWEIVQKMKNNNGVLSNNELEILFILENVLIAKENKTKMQSHIVKYQNIIENNYNINTQKLIREVNYNQSNLFLWSLIFYILTLVSLLSLSIFRLYNSKYRLLPLLLIIIGFLYHLTGIIIRITILERPPVSTLYESIIFVGLISVMFGIILEIIKKDNLSLMIGSIAGIALHYISFGYAADGDTLGVLIAVLNSNFWLSTHVTTITTGYGATVICSLIGHLYLIKMLINPDNKTQLKTIYNNMLAMTFIALFFTMFGTILGGIWGDQSWGRFWGWDPKENGALLIVMWLLMMIHLKISGMVKPEGYALGLVLANITVALAWFGVNLLSVGLHSYGFTDGAALNLFLFITFEIIFGMSIYGLIKYRNRF